MLYFFTLWWRKPEHNWTTLYRLQIWYLQISAIIGMELYREVGFLVLSRAQGDAGNLKLSCKGQYRLAVYPCTQCKSQIWQGAKEESDVEIYQKLVISSKSWKCSAPYSPFEKIEIGKLLMKFPIYIKIWSYSSRFWKYDSHVIWVP